VLKLVALLFSIVAALIDGELEAGRHFRVDGNRIVGPDDETFVPLGVNMLGPDAFFHENGVTLGHAKVLREAWKVNTVRLNMCLPEGCWYNDIHNERNDDLDAIVDEYTDEGIVVMIALHQVKPGHWPNDEQLDRLAAFWHDTAARYADNPLVWFNLLNEPGSDRPANRRWLDIHRRLLSSVREAGAENLVVVDGTVWGQESGENGHLRVAEEDSAILTFGPELKGEDDAVAFSFHVYDGWGWQAFSDAERDARMADYIDRVHAKGLALVIGEAGGDYEPCCSRSALALQTLFRVVPGKGVGILMWHGQAIDQFKLVYAGRGEARPSDLDDWTNPTNLTWQGRLFWDLTHG
jgi:mannan endo-1,4-beta-mannosidase